MYVHVQLAYVVVPIYTFTSVCVRAPAAPGPLQGLVWIAFFFFFSSFNFSHSSGCARGLSLWSCHCPHDY